MRCGTSLYFLTQEICCLVGFLSNAAETDKKYFHYALISCSLCGSLPANIICQ